MHRASSLQKDALKKHLQRRLRRDRSASWLIHFGGWLVLAALLVLLWHLISVVLPMFRSPAISLVDNLDVNVSGEVVYYTQLQGSNIVVTRQPDCSLAFFQKAKNKIPFELTKCIPLPCEDKAIFHEANGYYYLLQLTANKMLRISELTFLEWDVYTEQVFSVRLPDLVNVDSPNWQMTMSDQDWVLSLPDTTGWQLIWLDPKNIEVPIVQHLPEAERLALLPDNSGMLVQSGKWVRHLDKNQRVIWEQELASEIEYLAATPSGKGFIVHLSNHQIQKWIAIYEHGKLKYHSAFQLEGVEQLQQLLFISHQMLGLAYTNDYLILFNSVTGEVLNRQEWNELVAIDTTADTTAKMTKQEHLLGLLSTHSQLIEKASDKTLLLFEIQNANAGLTLRNLFAQVWYEGYQSPDYVWQSSSGSDNNEAKYSVIPLVIGSIKAAILAIVVALPLGLGAAVYTAYFAPANSRQWLKPAIEMLEAIPSVVIGFIAAVWLLPLAEEHLAAALSFFVLLPLFVLIIVLLNKTLLKMTGKTLPVNLQYCFVYLLIFAFILSTIVPLVMAAMTSLDLPSIFFLEEQDTHSKNTIVVAIALGIAISPSIYSLAEDAIYEVPAALRKASYALGATRLQTLLNVVLKVAYPGILSALMLGFSRALGETMILLMVTGNTPIAEWDLVEGMRTLTANLAIELPESEVGGIHYQVLFLTALLLLVFTMGINTVAELLRLRLRKKYRHD